MTARKILVTGGTGTLGGALVRALCEDGWDVTANFSRDTARAEELQRTTGCRLYQADVSDENEVAAMFAALRPLDAVVHCAGIVRDGLILRTATDAWRETLRVNLQGPFLVARGALQSLNDGGSLILVTSRVGERGAAGQAAYAAAKAATIGLMKTAGREAARLLRVNAICPPFVPSALSDDLDQTELAALGSQSLSGGFGTVNGFVGAVRWLLSEDCAGISGQVIHCDDRIF